MICGLQEPPSKNFSLRAGIADSAQEGRDIAVLHPTIFHPQPCTVNKKHWLHSGQIEFNILFCFILNFAPKTVLFDDFQTIFWTNFDRFFLNAFDLDTYLSSFKTSSFRSRVSLVFRSYFYQKKLILDKISLHCV